MRQLNLAAARVRFEVAVLQPAPDHPVGQQHAEHNSHPLQLLLQAGAPGSCTGEANRRRSRTAPRGPSQPVERVRHLGGGRVPAAQPRRGRGRRLA